MSTHGGTPPSSPGGSSGGTPPEEPPQSLRARFRTALAWLRAHSKHALVVAVAAALVGGITPVVTTGLWGEWFGDKPAKCPGSACDGKNPQTTGCGADAVTWRPKGPNPTSLHVRYSKHCQAIWGRITTGEMGDGVTVQVRGRSSQSGIVEFGHDQFTPMASVGDSFHVRACAVPTTSLARVGKWDRYCVEATDKAPWKETG